MKPLRFRPHHFLCTVGFEGKGYSPTFVENFQKVCDRLRAENGDMVEVEVVEEADTICTPCPHRRSQFCATDAKIKRLDQAHAEVLGITVGDRLTWGEAKKRIKQRISVITHLEICQGCEWLDQQVCRQALERLISES